MPAADDPGAGEALVGAPLADERVALEVTDSERVLDGRIWDVRRDTVAYGGRPVVRDYVEHPGAVGVLALDDDDRVFLIKQYRHPIRTRDWEIPAGLLDVDGEGPLAAAKRELAEEGDLVAAEWSVLIDINTSPGGSDEVIRVFLARGLSSAPEAFGREDEEADLETRWVPLDECIDAVLAGRLHNAPLAVALLALDAARRRGLEALHAADAPWPSGVKPGPAA
ncbi:NUDIX domain-containing protein [Agromyces sp. MMS24-K17]|uniref:NUDIX domain-containing protein n=1 Tax=Agromyces sp. MMS24-K17 TaxID=3372850 RepID=UPI003754E831